jgi:alkylation response protein AidB-like acyl-CoA dehydrogenase
MGDISIVSKCWHEYENLVEMAQKTSKDGQPASKDPTIRQKLAECLIDLMVVRQIGYRNLAKLSQGKPPGPEGSISKLFWSELFQQITELSMEIQGPYSQLTKGSSRTIDNGLWQHEFLHASVYTLGGGTSEIQRNIIAERVLGLPKEPS